MLLVYYLIVINMIAFTLFGIDKAKARADKWRIPEHTLLLFVFLGGEIGGFLGMKVFHHKTKKNKFRITVPILLVVELVLIVFFLYQNYHLVVTEYTFKSGKIADELDGYRIVQISDLHNQWFGKKQRKLLSMIEECKPDIIVVTGDAVDSNHTNYEITLDFFEGAVGIAPVYYITGNHEEWLQGTEEYSDYLNKVEQMGVNYIDGKTVEIDGFELSGMAGMSVGKNVSNENLVNEEISNSVDTKDGSNKTLDKDNVDDENKESSGDKVLSVVLSHEPGYYDADLIFAGHIHGGQFIIPGKGGLLSPDFSFFPEYYGDMYDLENAKLVVSRGLGNSIVPVRINNYPEIVVVEFEK